MRMANTTKDDLLRLFHGKRTALNYFIAGFVDGEGCFSVAILKNPFKKEGWLINPCFQVYQHQNHKEVLELCQEVFKTGRIYRKSGTHPVLNFSIDSMRNIKERVIPFFDKYPLVTKREAYQAFRDIVLSMDRKEHLTPLGFERLVRLAYSMNQQGKGRRKSLEEILSTQPKLVLESSETLRRTSGLVGTEDDKVQPPGDRKE
jgi:hypothetical protein